MEQQHAAAYSSSYNVVTNSENKSNKITARTKETLSGANGSVIIDEVSRHMPNKLLFRRLFYESSWNERACEENNACRRKEEWAGSGFDAAAAFSGSFATQNTACLAHPRHHTAARISQFSR